MPAVRYFNGSTHHVINQSRDALLSRIHTYTSGGEIIAPQWYGFVCNSGTSYLKGSKIVRLLVDAISSGDGNKDEEWIVLPEGHFALGCWIPDKSPTKDDGELYCLIDDLGWPMTTLRYSNQT